jgi:hypothetical protein
MREEFQMRQAVDHYRMNVSAISAAEDGAIEPLEPQSWFRALAKLAERTGRASSDEPEPLLRHAYHLLQLAPRPLGDTVRSDLTEAKYEQLLDCGAFEAAAVGLVGRPMNYAIFRPQADLFEAQVCLPGQARPIVARAPSLPMALLAAWTQCLAALETGLVPRHLAALES